MLKETVEYPEMLPLPRMPTRSDGQRWTASPLRFAGVGDRRQAAFLPQNWFCGFMLNPSPLSSALNVFKQSVCFLGVLGAGFSLAGPALAPSLKMGV